MERTKKYFYSIKDLVAEELVSPQEYDKLVEHITIWSGLVRPDYRYSNQLMRSALLLHPPKSTESTAIASIMAVTVKAAAHDARQIKASGVFFIDRSAETDMNVTMLSWGD